MGNPSESGSGGVESPGQGGHGRSGRNGVRRSTAALIVVLALGLGLRLVWGASFTQVIDNEGAGYARLAENLASGRGYVDMTGGPHVLYPPLYPLLIAAARTALPSSEDAARVINLLAGLAMILLLVRAGRELGGRTLGLVVGILAAVHGLTVALSVATYGEGIFFPLSAAALAAGLTGMRTGRARPLLLAGACWGLAYLVRPQAIAYAVTTAGMVGLAWWIRARSFRAAWPRAALPLVATAVVAAPYAIWLSVLTGAPNWEGKSAANGVISERIALGMSYPEAARGLDDAGRPAGPYLFADQVEARRLTERYPRHGILDNLFSDLPARFRATVIDTVRQPSLGGVVYFLLVLLGVVSGIRRRRTRWGTLFLVAHLAAFGTVLLSIRFAWTRHIFPAVVFALPLAGLGLVVVARASSSLAGSLAGRARAASIVRFAAPPAALLLVAVVSWRGCGSLGEFRQAKYVSLRDAGEWIHDRTDSAELVMTMSYQLAYYAHCRCAYFGWTRDEDLAKSYIRGKHPRFLVISSLDVPQAPYLEAWGRRGSAPPELHECVRFRDPEGVECAVFEWTDLPGH